MNTPPQISIRWRARQAPLAPLAVAAQGAVAGALAQRLLALADEELLKLRGVAGEGLLIALGEADALPWVDGVRYLGCDSAAPSLLLPTVAEPDVPLALFERALLQRWQSLVPLVVLPSSSGCAVASAQAAREISRAQLLDWLERHRMTG